jgi:surfactin family lipopeptide synthetase A
MVIGTLAPAGRKRSEVQHLFGYFLNPVPLRINLRGNPTFRELLWRVRETVLEAIVNDDVPLDGLPCSAGRPLFDTVISLAPALPDLGPGWRQSFMDVESGGSRWPLYLELSERSAELTGRAQFNPDVFDAATITRILQHWQCALANFADKPEMRLGEASLPIANE